MNLGCTSSEAKRAPGLDAVSQNLRRKISTPTMWLVYRSTWHRVALRWPYVPCEVRNLVGSTVASVVEDLKEVARGLLGSVRGGGEGCAGELLCAVVWALSEVQAQLPGPLLLLLMKA